MKTKSVCEAIISWCWWFNWETLKPNWWIDNEKNSNHICDSSFRLCNCKFLNPQTEPNLKFQFKDEDEFQDEFHEESFGGETDEAKRSKDQLEALQKLATECSEELGFDKEDVEKLMKGDLGDRSEESKVTISSCSAIRLRYQFVPVFRALLFQEARFLQRRSWGTEGVHCGTSFSGHSISSGKADQHDWCLHGLENFRRMRISVWGLLKNFAEEIYSSLSFSAPRLHRCASSY